MKTAKASAFTADGTVNTMGGERPRNDADAYYTPDALALAIAERVYDSVGGGDFGLVIEPSAGAGAFVRAAQNVWPEAYLYAVEPSPDAPTPVVSNSLTFERRSWENSLVLDHLSNGPRALIIGNPPYNLPGDGRGENPTTAERHVHLAIERMRDGDVLAFLLRLSFLSGGSRTERLHTKHPLAALWPVTPRPSFTLDGKTDGSEYGVFVWQKGYSGKCDLRPLAWKK